MSSILGEPVPYSDAASAPTFVNNLPNIKLWKKPWEPAGDRAASSSVCWVQVLVLFMVFIVYIVLAPIQSLKNHKQ
jgi:hypothetical protein